MSTTCQHTKKNGQPCGAYALRGSAYCFSHDPASAAQRAESRSRGGKARHGRTLTRPAESAPAVLQTPGDMLAVLEGELNAVLGLETSLHRARTVAALVGVALKTLELNELAALAERMAALENAVYLKGEA